MQMHGTDHFRGVFFGGCLFFSPPTVGSKVLCVSFSSEEACGCVDLHMLADPRTQVAAKGREAINVPCVYTLTAERYSILVHTRTTPKDK
jgi:hypothetical protein